MGDLREDAAGAPAEGSAHPRWAGPAGAQIAGFWRRIWALLIDMLLLAGVGLTIGTLAYRQVVALGQEGRLIGAAITLLYFGILNSGLGGGATLGKRMMSLRVVARDGQSVGLFRALVRTIVFWTPYYLNGVIFPASDLPANVAVATALGALLVFAVFGGFVLIVYFCVFNRRTRQSLHDLVTGTFVVRSESAGVPVHAHFWKAHIAFALATCLLVVAIPATILFYISRSSMGGVLNRTAAVQNAVLAHPGVDTAQVTVNTMWFTSTNGTSTTRTTLQVNVRMRDATASAEKVQDDIAEIVFRAAPTLLDQQNLSVGVSTGYDLGIFAWTNTSGYVNTPEEWKKKLQARQVGDSA
jgi:uncharacterized RDD family membrane protein YckC